LPTYEYACTACGHRLEAVQSFSDDPLTECPECGGSLRKVYAPVGIVLKGSGFYKTDSRAAANGSAKKGASATSESSGGESAGSSKDSKDSKESQSSASSGSDGAASDKGTGQGTSKEPASAASSTA
jgi:putative FmdB family regulatory protein